METKMNEAIMWLEIERQVLPDSDRMLCQDCGEHLKETFWQIGVISIATRGRKVCSACAVKIRNRRPKDI